MQVEVEREKERFSGLTGKIIEKIRQGLQYLPNEDIFPQASISPRVGWCISASEPHLGPNYYFWEGPICIRSPTSGLWENCIGNCVSKAIVGEFQHIATSGPMCHLFRYMGGS
jgi:hypothetical protein